MLKFDKQPNFQDRSHHRQSSHKYMSRKQPSVIVRRMRAKLRAFSQPQFIISAVAFSLFGFFLWRTLFPANQANLFERAIDSSQGQLDPDSQAAGVDLDSLQVLLSDLNSNNANNINTLPPVNLLNPQQLNRQATRAQQSAPGNLLQQQPGSTVSILPGATPGTSQPTSAYPLLNYNPALNQASGTGSSSSTRMNFAPIGLTNPAVPANTFPGLTRQTMIGGSQRSSPLPPSALQSAMNQAQQNATAQSNQAVPTGQFFPPNYNQSYFGPPTTYFPPGTVAPAAPVPTTSGINYQSIPTGNTSYQVNPNNVSTMRRSVPLTQPIPTGPSLVPPPAVPIDPVNLNSLRQPSGANSSGQPGYGYNQGNTFGGAQNTPTVQNAPAAPAPYSVPGTIGNGYINTFSNPAGPPSN